MWSDDLLTTLEAAVQCCLDSSNTWVEVWFVLRDSRLFNLGGDRGCVSRDSSIIDGSTTTGGSVGRRPVRVARGTWTSLGPVIVLALRHVYLRLADQSNGSGLGDDGAALVR